MVQPACQIMDTDTIRNAYESAMRDTNRRYGRGEVSARNTARTLFELVNRHGEYGQLIALGERSTRCQNLFELVRMLARCYSEVADREEAQPLFSKEVSEYMQLYQICQCRASELLVCIKATLHHTIAQRNILDQRGVLQVLASLEKIMHKQEWWSVAQLFYPTEAKQVWEQYSVYCDSLRAELRAAAAAATRSVAAPRIGEWPGCQLHPDLTPLALGSAAPCNVDTKWWCTDS